VKHLFRPTVIVIAFAAVLLVLVARMTDGEDWRRSGPPYPAYEPFSLSSYDVLHAVAMIQRSWALVYVNEDGGTETLPVRSVRSVWVGFDPDAFENHQNRYDVELNGEPLDWDRTYIEYDGELVNLRILFSYNNQRPIPEVEYRVQPR
jgi:hypothetical protein